MCTQGFGPGLGVFRAYGADASRGKLVIRGFDLEQEFRRRTSVVIPNGVETKGECAMERKCGKARTRAVNSESAVGAA
jgi:hypothetical protein